MHHHLRHTWPIRLIRFWNIKQPINTMDERSSSPCRTPKMIISASPLQPRYASPSPGHEQRGTLVDKRSVISSNPDRTQPTLPLGLIQPAKEINTIANRTTRVVGVVGNFCCSFLECLPAVSAVSALQIVEATYVTENVYHLLFFKQFQNPLA